MNAAGDVIVEQRKTVKYVQARFMGLTGRRETWGHPSLGMGSYVSRNSTSSWQGVKNIKLEEI
jgi:hypothetical protein